MKNRIILLSACVLATALSVKAQSYMAQPRVNQSISFNNSRLNMESTKYKQILFLLANAYVDTLNVGRVSEDAMIHLMQQLDPHSVYISAKDVKDMEEPLMGKFEGIGIEYALIRDTLTEECLNTSGATREPRSGSGLSVAEKRRENS